MAKTKKSKTALIIAIVVVPIVLVGILVIHWFVYPFTSASPNFADVEAVYNKLQIPSDWQVIEESENRGIAGRQCPVESDSCFNTQKVYTLPSGSQKEDVQKVVLSSGCVSTTTEDKSQKGDTRERYYFECMSGLIRVSGSWQDENGSLTGRVTTWSR